MAERKPRRAARPLAAALAATMLAGCAADYVGDDWQCPLAQGRVCASVAAADPAVPETRVPETLVPETRAPATRVMAGPVDDIPPYRRFDGRIAAGAPAGRVDEPGCESDCDPLAWLAGLFAGPADPEPGAPERADAGRDAYIEEAGTAVFRSNSVVATAAIAGSGSPSGNSAASTPGAAPDSVAAGHSASCAWQDDSPAISSGTPNDAPAPAEGQAATDGSSAPVIDDAFRTGEVVARIWIAPFVDADGIYREGAWVRAVIAPAGWRLP